MTTLLKHTIYNELSQARNPHNMAVLGAVFQHSGQQAAAVLADVFLVREIEDVRLTRLTVCSRPRRPVGESCFVTVLWICTFVKKTVTCMYNVY